MCAKGPAVGMSSKSGVGVAACLGRGSNVPGSWLVVDVAGCLVATIPSLVRMARKWY